MLKKPDNKSLITLTMMFLIGIAMIFIPLIQQRQEIESDNSIYAMIAEEIRHQQEAELVVTTEPEPEEEPPAEELPAEEPEATDESSEKPLPEETEEPNPEETPEAERAENETPAAENEEKDSYDGLLSEPPASEGSILEIAEKRDYFDDIFISSDYGVKKPDPLFWKAVLGKLDLDPSECLMVGNDLRCDIESAQKVGIDGFYMMSLLSPDADKERVRSGEPLPAKYVQIGTNLETVRNRILSIEQE